jgi:hypothetical protein
MPKSYAMCSEFPIIGRWDPVEGAKVLIGGMIPVHVPPDLSGGNFEKYEPEAIGVLSGWIRDHPGGLLIDIVTPLGKLSISKSHDSEGYRL